MLERERWEIDGARSTLSFALRHMVISEIQGRFGRWGGEISVDPDHLDRTVVDVWIEVASIDTGSVERDDHLLSPEFLDIARYPRAEFRSTAVALRSDGGATVTGRLRLHGVTDLVDITVSSRGTWIDDAGVMRAGYSIRGKFDRQLFGLHWNQDLDVGGFVVGDNVDLEAKVEVMRAPEAARAAGSEQASASAPGQ